MQGEPHVSRLTAAVVGGLLVLAAVGLDMPWGGVWAMPAEQGGAQAECTAPLSLATATAAELELLPGVGPSLAERIVQDRAANGPFATVEDLDRVKGVGPAMLERVSPYLVP